MSDPRSDESSSGLDILFVFRRGREERIARHRDGEGPDEMLYGLNYLTSRERADRFI